MVSLRMHPRPRPKPSPAPQRLSAYRSFIIVSVTSNNIPLLHPHSPVRDRLVMAGP